jgi:hypothetical protein
MTHRLRLIQRDEFFMLTQWVEVALRGRRCHALFVSALKPSVDLPKYYGATVLRCVK